jgi:hypothetical protein
MDPFWIFTMVCGGWEGEDQAGDKGHAELSVGVAAPVVASESAINPSGLPPMLHDG